MYVGIYIVRVYGRNMDGELKRIKQKLNELLRDGQSFDDLFYGIYELVGEEQ
jgi:hypothetical protein